MWIMKKLVKIFEFNIFQFYQSNAEDLSERVKHLEEFVALQDKQLEIVQSSYDKLIRANRLLYNKNVCTFNVL